MEIYEQKSKFIFHLNDMFSGISQDIINLPKPNKSFCLRKTFSLSYISS